nr:lysophospholipid acyltransferase family protein [Georgenia faecalis]
MVITRRRWSGQEHLPAQGGVIAAANHVTNVDPLTFAHFLYDSGRAPRILAKDSLFTVPGFGWLLRKTGQIPVHRGSARAGDSLEAAVAALEKGECVAVFPEGTLTRDPEMWPMTAKTGVARLALTTRAPVIPVAQWGAHELLGRYSTVLKPVPPKTVYVQAGPPVDLSDLYDRPQDAAVLREATSRVMAAITAMLADIRHEEPPSRPYDMRRDGDPRAAAKAAQRQGK